MTKRRIDLSPDHPENDGNGYIEVDLVGQMDGSGDHLVRKPSGNYATVSKGCLSRPPMRFKFSEDDPSEPRPKKLEPVWTKSASDRHQQKQQQQPQGDRPDRMTGFAWQQNDGSLKQPEAVKVVTGNEKVHKRKSGDMLGNSRNMFRAQSGEDGVRRVPGADMNAQHVQQEKEQGKERPKVFDGVDDHDGDVPLYDAIHGYHSNPSKESFQQLAASAREQYSGDKERWLTNHLTAGAGGRGFKPDLLRGVKIPDTAPDSVRHAMENDGLGAIFNRKISHSEMMPDESFDTGDLDKQIEQDRTNEAKADHAKHMADDRDRYESTPSINSDRGRNLRAYLEDDSHADEFWRHTSDLHREKYDSAKSRNNQLRELFGRKQSDGKWSITGWQRAALNREDASEFKGFDQKVQAVRDNPSDYSALLGGPDGESSGEGDIESMVLEALRNGMTKIPSVHDDDFLEESSQAFYSGSKEKMSDEELEQMRSTPFAEGWTVYDA